MKPKKDTVTKKLPKGFTIKPGLSEEYADQPLFKDKLEKANDILKKFGPPKADQ